MPGLESDGRLERLAHFVDPATVPSAPNTYFIGPYGRRINFASQQRRVLNTLWALEEAGKLNGDARIAVVGAGLAGITAAVGLAAREFSVMLFEAEPEAFRKQSETNHRYLHPTINFWPEERLTPSTAFPYFDWAAGVCDDVVRQIFAEWEEISTGNIHIRRYIYRKKYNTKIVEIKCNNSSVSLTSSDGEAFDFDVAIITTGFGDEIAVSGTDTRGYWIQDNLESRVRDKTPADFVISGIGDGGLIDTLRLIHKRFEYGKLCMRVAQNLDAQRATLELAAIEREAKKIHADLSVIADSADSSTIKYSSEQAAFGYSEFYHTAISGYINRTLPDETRHLIESSQINDRKRIIEMVGPLPYPYSIAAAPIHKLLIAFALHEKIVSYTQGRLLSEDGKLIISSSSENREIITQYTIARHGSKYPVSTFISSEDELERLKRRQEEADDWARLDFFPKDYFNFPGYPPNDSNNPAFVQSRYSKAKEYLWNFHQVDISVHLRKCCFFAKKIENMESIPKDIFGIPIFSGETPKKYRSAVRGGT